MNRVSRRGILGGAAALVPTAGGGEFRSSPVHPDAALIAASARFAGACQVFNASCEAEPDDGDPRKPRWEAQEGAAADACDALATEMLALPCTTLAGAVALAAAVVAHTPEVMNPSAYTDQALMGRLVAAVLALRGAL